MKKISKKKVGKKKAAAKKAAQPVTKVSAEVQAEATRRQKTRAYAEKQSKEFKEKFPR